jgi:hypothetical protein
MIFNQSEFNSIAEFNSTVINLFFYFLLAWPAIEPATSFWNMRLFNLIVVIMASSFRFAKLACGERIKVRYLFHDVEQLHSEGRKSGTMRLFLS